VLPLLAVITTSHPIHTYITAKKKY